MESNQRETCADCKHDHINGYTGERDEACTEVEGLGGGDSPFEACECPRFNQRVEGEPVASFPAGACVCPCECSDCGCYDSDGPAMCVECACWPDGEVVAPLPSTSAPKEFDDPRRQADFADGYAAAMAEAQVDGLSATDYKEAMEQGLDMARDIGEDLLRAQRQLAEAQERIEAERGLGAVLARSRELRIDALEAELRADASAFETLARCFRTGATWGDSKESDAEWAEDRATRLRALLAPEESEGKQ